MPENKKVLLVVENLSVPADPRVWREAQTLRQHGYQVSVICPQGETRDQQLYVYLNGIHIYRYRLSTTIERSTDYFKEYAVAMIHTFRLSLKIWRKHGFDIIHAANPPDTFFVLGLFYRFFGKKFIFDQHDLAPEIFRIKFKDRTNPLYKVLLILLQLVEVCSYRTANIIITTNESQRRNAIKRGHCRENKIMVVRNGPDEVNHASITLDLERKRGRKYLLAYIGVMGLQDGVENALFALNELVNKRGRNDVSLVLMGDGDQLPALKNLAHDLELNDHVHFTGWVEKNDLLHYLTVSDIGLSPDPYNTLNNHSTMLKTMEYMALGLPVVAFDLLETRYSAQEAALYATPNVIEDFADHIEYLLEHEEVRQSMGAYGRQRIVEKLSWRQSSQHLLQAYAMLSGSIEKYTTPDASESSTIAQSIEQTAQENTI